MKSSRPALLVPSRAALAQLERAACGNLTIARLTLGLLDAIRGDAPGPLFPDYHWRLSAIEQFPPKFAASARQLLEWGLKRGVVLNELFASYGTITSAVVKMRRQSPYGRRRIAIANRWRKKFPLLKPSDRGSSPGKAPLRVVDILGDEVGRPLGACTLRLAQAFNPSQVEILAPDEGEYADWPGGGIRIRLGEDGYTVESIRFRVEVKPAERPRIIYGVLEDYFETGTEGVIWSVLDDDERSYDALAPIEAGDHLTILDQLGREMWSGKIRCDRKAGWRRYPMNPKYGQPCALGYWIHWTQHGFKPDDWASYFIRPQYDRLRGLLRKKRP